LFLYRQYNREVGCHESGIDGRTTKRQIDCLDERLVVCRRQIVDIVGSVGRCIASVGKLVAVVVESLKRCLRVCWIAEGITRSWLSERDVETSGSVRVTATTSVSRLSRRVLQICISQSKDMLDSCPSGVVAFL
jgi:hypothetical protein